MGIDGVKTISAALAIGTPNLERLALTRNRAENEGAIALANSLPNLNKLKELVIFQDVVKKDGMVKLLSALTANCKDLELLDIRDNFLREEAVEEITKLIKTCTKLTALNISDCNIEEDENDAIIEAISESEANISKLGYNYAELNADQAKKLLDVLLKKGITITVRDPSHITFAHSFFLQRLDIKGNDFSKSTRKFYQEKLAEKGEKFLKALSYFDSDDEEEDHDPATQLI